MIKLPSLHFAEITSEEQMPILRERGGVYMFLDNNDNVLYVGKAQNLLARLNQWVRGSGTDAFLRYGKRYKFSFVSNPADRDMYETYYINLLQPPYNSQKTFTYDSLKCMKEYEAKYTFSERTKTVKWKEEAKAIQEVKEENRKIASLTKGELKHIIGSVIDERLKERKYGGII